MTTEAVYWSGAVPRAGFSSSCCSRCPSPPHPLPAASWSSRLLSVLWLFRQVTRFLLAWCRPGAWLFKSRQSLGKDNVERAGGREVSRLAAQGGSDARTPWHPQACHWLRREAPRGDECPGATCRGPCCRWELVWAPQGTARHPPAPVLAGVNAGDLSDSADPGVPLGLPGAGSRRKTALGVCWLRQPLQGRSPGAASLREHAGAQIGMC